MWYWLPTYPQTHQFEQQHFLFFFVPSPYSFSLKCWHTYLLTIHTSPRCHPTAIAVWGCMIRLYMQAQQGAVSSMAPGCQYKLNHTIVFPHPPDSITISGMNKSNRDVRFTDKRVILPRQLFVSRSFYRAPDHNMQRQIRFHLNMNYADKTHHDDSTQKKLTSKYSNYYRLHGYSLFWLFFNLAILGPFIRSMPGPSHLKYCQHTVTMLVSHQRGKITMLYACKNNQITRSNTILSSAVDFLYFSIWAIRLDMLWK